MLWTNRGKFLMLDWVFHAEALPTNMYVALCTDAIAPTVDMNTFTELTEIAAGNGYTTGGYQLTPGAGDFDVMTEDDALDMAIVQIKDLVWTAVAGPIPSAGDDARYAVLIDDNGVVANRQIIAAWDLVTGRSCTATFTITLENCELRAIEP